MDHGFMQQYSIFCKPHFSTDHWAEATCPPLLFIVQYLWQGKKQDGAGTHCTHCHVVLYSDYVFNLLYRNCIDSAEFGQAEHWNLFCLDIQHQECLDFHLKKEREEKKRNARAATSNEFPSFCSISIYPISTRLSVVVSFPFGEDRQLSQWICLSLFLPCHPMKDVLTRTAYTQTL